MSGLGGGSCVGRRVVAAAFVSAVACGWLALAAPAAHAACRTGSVTFSSTGAEQCYVVPAGVTSVHVVAIGAPGAPGATQNFGAGGEGAEVTDDLAVTPGDTLFVEVGGLATSGNFGNAGTGGFNGGGAGGAFVGGGGGGGASDVRRTSCGDPCNPLDPTSLSSRLLIAAGGGGGGGGSMPRSGNGGAAGQSGAPGGGSSAGGGGAATASGGGSAGAASGCGGASGSIGASGQGGAAGTGNNGAGGGGGGGGLFGGGGGGSASDNQSCSAAGGGGGSSFGPAGTTTALDTTGTPSVTITPPRPTATITAPASGGRYNEGQQVATAFSCVDSGGTIGSCSDSNGTSGGSGHLDTSTPGTHTYTVTATSLDGATDAASISYTVSGPPTATITSPATGGSYIVGQRVATTFSCAEGASGPGLASCTDSNGTGGGSGRLDTTTLGAHTYTVTAKSGDGLTTVANISYTVVRPLRITIGKVHSAGHRSIITLACHGGTAVAVCHGTLSLTIRKLVHHGGKSTFVTVVLAKHSYAVRTGQTRRISLKVTGAPRRHQHVKVTATLRGGRTTSR